ncbi:MAG: hypothetical protein AAF493_25230, partial [Pseudomonadota bacterium]
AVIGARHQRFLVTPYPAGRFARSAGAFWPLEYIPILRILHCVQDRRAPNHASFQSGQSRIGP